MLGRRAMAAFTFPKQSRKERDVDLSREDRPQHPQSFGACGHGANEIGLRAAADEGRWGREDCRRKRRFDECVVGTGPKLRSEGGR